MVMKRKYHRVAFTAAQKTEPKDWNDSPEDGVHAKISNFIEGLKSRTPLDNAGSWKMLSIADQTLDAMQGTIARQKLAA